MTDPLKTPSVELQKLIVDSVYARIPAEYVETPQLFLLEMLSTVLCTNALGWGYSVEDVCASVQRTYAAVQKAPIAALDVMQTFSSSDTH